MKKNRVDEVIDSKMRLYLRSIWNNVECWDEHWTSCEGRYQQMTREELGSFNAELNVLANDTMNKLSLIRKQLIMKGVPFEEKATSFSFIDILISSEHQSSKDDCS